MKRSIPTSDEDPLIAVLAAGLASRFGEDKLNLDCAGKPLGSWIFDIIASAGFAPGIVICRSPSPSFLREYSDWRSIPVDQSKPSLSQSVKAAVKEAVVRRAKSLVICLADMPAIDPKHLRSIGTAGGLVATEYPDGRLGVPAKFPSTSFPALLEMEGAAGAGHLLNELDEVTSISAQPSSLIDVDRPAELKSASATLINLQLRQRGCA